MADVRIVAWKELREILHRGNEKRRRSPYRVFVFPILIGIFFGLQTARGAAGFAVFPVGLMAMSTTIGLITDAIAGERERHTLETLLASPASDLAILGGKLTAVVGYAWVVALVQLLAITATSVAVGHALSPVIVVVVAGLSLLEAVLAAGFGVQFSLRAPTVRVAAREARSTLDLPHHPGVVAQCPCCLGPRWRALCGLALGRRRRAARSRCGTARVGERPLQAGPAPPRLSVTSTQSLSRSTRFHVSRSLPDLERLAATTAPGRRSLRSTRRSRGLATCHGRTTT